MVRVRARVRLRFRVRVRVRGWWLGLDVAGGVQVLEGQHDVRRERDRLRLWDHATLLQRVWGRG